MTGFDFFNLLGENILSFVFSMILAIMIYTFIANKIATSWMNPLKFNVFTAGIGIGVVIFLFFTGNISFITFAYVLLSSCLFWSIFIFIFNGKQRSLSINIMKERFYADRLFWVLYVLYISLTLFSYKKFGIPLFNDDSRLAVYTGSGGFGLIQRLQTVMNMYSVFYLFCLYYNRRCTWLKLLILFSPIIFIGILSGSRSSFLIFIFAYWGAKTFYLGNEPKLSQYKRLLVPFLVISIVTFFLQSGDLSSAVTSFGERIVACGDLYWQALPYESWKLVKVEEPVKFIFTGLLGPLRLIDVSQIEAPIGFQLTDITYPGLNRMTGPVTLFPVGSLIFYGYIGGLFFTAVQALFASFAFRIVYVKSNSIIVCAISYYMFTELIPWLGDAAAAMSSLFNILVSLILVFIILLFIGVCAKTTKKYI